MGAPGACTVCSDRRRPQIDALRADGVPVATIARDFGIATTTLGRHLKHSRPAPAPVSAPAAPKPTRPPAPRHPKAEDPDPEVSFQRVRQAAALLGVPLGTFALCVTNHLEVEIVTATPEEEDELFAAWDEADDSPEYCAAVVRNGKFISETAGR